MSASITALLLVGCLATVLAQGERGIGKAMFLDAVLADYDSDVIPTFDKNTPTDVYVALHINGIDSVNEQTMDFTLNLFVTQSWKDDRLEFIDLIDADYLELDSKLIHKFWVPDLYFVNEKSSKFHSVTVPNRLLHLYKDGTVLYKIRISLTATCDMALQKFPMDEQNCTLYMKSFGYSNNSLQLKWDETTPLTRNQELKMSQFTLVGLQRRECHDGHRETANKTANGTASGKGRSDSVFTCLAVDFLLVRSVGFYMIQIYIPSALIVFLSWVSFVLDIGAVPARISLGILTVLTMTNMKTIAVSSLPKVSYIKAIDVWMAACLSFVFASLLEFALVNAFSRRVSAPPQIFHTMPEAEPLNGKDAEKGPSKSPPNQDVVSLNFRAGVDRAKQLDKMSLVLFPVAFIFFVIIYTLVYL